MQSIVVGSEQLKDHEVHYDPTNTFQQESVELKKRVVKHEEKKQHTDIGMARSAITSNKHPTFKRNGSVRGIERWKCLSCKSSMYEDAVSAHACKAL